MLLGLTGYKQWWEWLFWFKARGCMPSRYFSVVSLSLASMLFLGWSHPVCLGTCVLVSLWLEKSENAVKTIRTLFHCTRYQTFLLLFFYWFSVQYQYPDTNQGGALVWHFSTLGWDLQTCMLLIGMQIVCLWTTEHNRDLEKNVVMNSENTPELLLNFSQTRSLRVI